MSTASPGSPGEEPLRFGGLPNMQFLRERFNQVRQEISSSEEESRDEARASNLRLRLEEVQQRKRSFVDP